MAADALFDPTVGRSPTWSVAELSAHIARVAAQTFPDDIWVTGEIRNLTRSQNGHCYFDLAEPTRAGVSPKNQLSVTLLAPERRFVNEVLIRSGGGMRMEDGIEVRIRARLRWWAPRGVLQLKMSDIDPAFTIGRLQADRERTLAALRAEGLLEANARRALPLVPLRVGLVTSRNSAAHADVVSELEHSGIAFVVRSIDARTQGPEAAGSIVRALTALSATGPGSVDVILVVRGGGARTDLVAFDTDLVCRAIAAATVPVFTGIGHEVDRSIADEVAHTSFKTPTAAAAGVIEIVNRYRVMLDERWAAIDQRARTVARAADARLDRRMVRVSGAARRNLDRQDRRLDAAASQTVVLTRRSLDRSGTLLATTAGRIVSGARRAITADERVLDAVSAQIRAHDPQSALERGWSITTGPDGRPVRDPATVTEGQMLTTRVAGGTIRSTVTSTDPVGPDEPRPTTPLDPQEHP